jgi:hypothetical protein
LVETHPDQTFWSKSGAFLFSLFTSLFDQHLGQKAILVRTVKGISNKKEQFSSVGFVENSKFNRIEMGQF